MATRAIVTPKKAIKTPERDSVPLEERVRQRAYELYLQRGGEDGSAVDDWLQAETEIDAEMNRASKG